MDEELKREIRNDSRAFPHVFSHRAELGLSMRDYFAAPKMLDSEQINEYVTITNRTTQNGVVEAQKYVRQAVLNLRLQILDEAIRLAKAKSNLSPYGVIPDA